MTLWIVGAAVASIVVVVAVFVFADQGPRPAEAEFLAAFRAGHPQLAPAEAPDDRLIDAARSECTPEGLTPADRRWLRSLGVDLDGFRDDARDLCPSR